MDDEKKIENLDRRLALVEKVVIGDPYDPKSKGLVQIMTRIDTSLDTLCAVAKAVGIGGTIGSMVFPVGRAFGWW